MLLCVSFGLTNQVWNYFEYFFVQNIFCVWDFKGRMCENLNFGKTGFKTCVLEKLFISFLCILLSIFNALSSVFKNQVVFSKILFFHIFDWSNLFFDQLKILLKFSESLYLFQSIKTDFRLIETRELGFLKTHIWLVQTSFSKLFKTFFSLSNSARLHKEFFVIFLWISCKVSLSLSRYVHITLPFELFFSFSCIISWFLGKILNYAQIGIFD